MTAEFFIYLSYFVSCTRLCVYTSVANMLRHTLSSWGVSFSQWVGSAALWRPCWLHYTTLITWCVNSGSKLSWKTYWPHGETGTYDMNTCSRRITHMVHGVRWTTAAPVCTNNMICVFTRMFVSVVPWRRDTVTEFCSLPDISFIIALFLYIVLLVIVVFIVATCVAVYCTVTVLVLSVADVAQWMSPCWNNEVQWV